MLPHNIERFVSADFPALAEALNKMNENIQALVPMQGKNTKLLRTAIGFAYEANPAAEEVPEELEARRFRVVVVFGDTLLCEEWDGTTAGAQVHVAKPDPFQRTLWHGKTFGSESYEFNTAGTQRTVSFEVAHGARTITAEIVEHITPPYQQPANGVLTSEIWAVRPEGGTGVMIGAVDGVGGEEVEWIDLNVAGRHWAQSYRVYEICDGGLDKKSIIRGGEPFV